MKSAILLEDDDIQFSRCVCYLLFLGAGGRRPRMS
jgi:hypothetical protein